MPSSHKGHISITGVSKYYGRHKALDDVSLEIPPGTVTVILGPSGSGKSTLLRTINHLERVDEGFIQIDGDYIGYRRKGDKLYEMKEKEILRQRINVGYVFQNYREAVFPWMRAIDNIRYPLQFLDVSKVERQALLDQVVDSFGVSFDLNRYPYQMSGGQQQLVSIMRALVIEPEVLFLDEPFSALDYEMVMFLRGILQKVLTERHVTTLLVSHDLDEAVLLADEVLLLTKRPTRVADRLAFHAPRPRDAATTVTPASFAAGAANCDVPSSRSVRGSGAGRGGRGETARIGCALRYCA